MNAELTHHPNIRHRLLRSVRRGSGATVESWNTFLESVISCRSFDDVLTLRNWRA